MHPFSIDTDERRRVPFVLATTAIVIAYGTWWILQALEVELPWWFGPPSLLGLYGALYALLERSLWRMQWVRTALQVRTPDLSGTWSGAITPASDNLAPTPARVTIHQSWTRISVRLETDGSRSTSTIGGITVAQNANPELVYEYRNEPRAQADQAMHAHRGLSRLEQIDRNTLDGDYFTGRDRNTFGSVHLEREP